MNQDTSKGSKSGTQYYRVILEGIDPKKETPESFAIKLSMKTRTPITRINNIVKNLPYPVKSGLSISQANKFSAVLEELGGIVSISSYILRPGKKREIRGTRWKRTGIQGVEGDLVYESFGELQEEGEKGLVCSNCGWENKETSEYCAFCYERFRRKQLTMRELSERTPKENPLPSRSKSADKGTDAPHPVTDRRLIFLACLVAVLILLIILKT